MIFLEAGTISMVKEDFGLQKLLLDGVCSVAKSYPTLCDPLPMRFSRQEYWSEEPF